ncbi:MAG: EAL domain-containing protein [Ruminococcus sp.]|nr:EAL domain-containing protein [Ruminococcus sp.]
MENENKFENFYNIDYGILHVNISELVTAKGDEGFCALSGYSEEELSEGVSLDALFDTDTVMAIKTLADSEEDTSGVLCYEHYLKTKDRRILTVTDFVWINKQENNISAIFYINRPKGALLDNKDIGEITSLKLFDTIISGIPGAVAIYEYKGEDLRIVKASDNYYETLGFKDKTAHSGKVGFMIDKSSNVDMFAKVKQCLTDGKPIVGEYQAKCPDGKTRWFVARAKPFVSQGGSRLIFVVINDITKSKQQENEINKQNKRFELIAKTTSEIYFDYDVLNDVFYLPNNDNYISRYSSRVEHYFGNRKYAEFIHQEDAPKLERALAEAKTGVTSGAIEYRTLAFDDDYTWYKLHYASVSNENGVISNIYGRITSIETEQMLKRRIDSDKKLIERLSERDLITGLYNRHTFKEKAAKYIPAIEDKRCYAIVYSDINDFSYVNENFGYDAGNRMLNDFADCIRETDVLIYSCRIYSDFYVGLYAADTRDKLIKAINKRNENFAELQKDHYPASDINISSGMYFITDKNVDITIAMDNANLARRSIKGSDDVLCGIYSERMRKERLRDQSIASEVKTAMEQGMIELFLQPKFDLVTRDIIGAEALARWRNADGSYKMPYEFIPVLEKVGLIIEFDFYMYEQVLKAFVKWRQEGRRLVPISVNFSRVHSNKDNFVDRVNSLADAYGVDKGLIEVEITESAFVEDVNIMIRYMSKLRDYGFKIDIDDFGIGYSSLSVLLNAPVDIVKVDKVFIDNIATNLLEREYVKQICQLIATTHKEVIFEGVETEEQANFLSSIGYNMAQGWLFDKAIPVKEFEDKYIAI